MVKMLLLNIILLTSLGLVALANGQTVTTTNGVIQGESVSLGLLSSMNRFLGIPYAAAPVGDLRFRAPIPHRGWEGTRDGTVIGADCPSAGSMREGTDEDCLFLNVYTPSTLGSSRPVMVFIHGGGFGDTGLGESGDTHIYGPEHLVRENAVVVTVNYRLGAFGFLSTGDNSSPGNYGLKDIILALRWIADNASVFGGNRNSINIFGHSAGSCLVHYLILSKAGRGLFHSAISQSGSALNPWCYHPNPLESALMVGGALGITTENTEDLIAQLRTKSAAEIVNATPDSISNDIPRGLYPSPFVPTRDPEDVDGSEIFLHDDPLTIIRSGDFNQVPYISGFTNSESLLMVRDLILNPLLFTRINNNPHVLIPHNWNIPAGSTESREITDAIYDFYFDGQQLRNELRWEWSQFLTDAMYAYGIDRHVKMHSSYQDYLVYYYKFTFEGSFSVLKTIALLGQFDGAVHGDDIFYLFSVSTFTPPVFPTNPAIGARNRFCRLWVNFARTNNPTVELDDLITSAWEPVNGNQEFIEFGDTLIPGTHPFEERMAFWHALQEKYAPDA